MDIVNQQVFGLRKPTGEILKNTRINPYTLFKTLKSKMSILYYVFFCVVLLNYQILISHMKKFKQNLIQPHQHMHFCSWLFFVAYTKFYMHDYDTKLWKHKNEMLHQKQSWYVYNV